WLVELVVSDAKEIAKFEGFAFSV
ncbi:hypothetical protein A2U01_0108554, partial [Trifolium medium]|nr:hypothetical protein [Trifolium medium]